MLFLAIIFRSALATWLSVQAITILFSLENASAPSTWNPAIGLIFVFFAVYMAALVFRDVKKMAKEYD